MAAKQMRIPNFDITCRGCTFEREELLPIWNANDDAEQSSSGGQQKPTKAKMLEALTELGVSIDDEFPKKMCKRCLDDLEKAFSIKTKFNKSEIQFKIILKIKQSGAMDEMIADEENRLQTHATHQPMKVECEEIDVMDETRATALDNGVASNGNLSRSKIKEEIDQIDTEDHNADKAIKVEHEVAENDDDIDHHVHIATESESNQDLLSKTQPSSSNLLDELTQPERKCSLCSKVFPEQHLFEQHQISHRKLKMKLVDGAPNLCKCTTTNNIGSEGGTVSKTAQIEKEKISRKLKKSATQKRNDKVTAKVEEGKKQSFVCEICDKAFARKTHLKRHLMYHTKTKPFKCAVCASSFVEKCYLNKHMIKHSGIRPFQCDICQQCFGFNCNLKRHILTIHNVSRPFVCEICNKAFGSKADLKRHLLIHAKRKQFECTICASSFVGEGHLTQHMIMHTGVKSFQCDICQQCFGFKGGLKQHILEIHNGYRPFVCEICNKAFGQKSNLKTHLMYHTKTKPFKCAICASSFVEKGHLNKHMIVHTSVKSFQCDICQQCFGFKGGLKQHILEIHNGYRPFVCEICNKAFGQKSNLKTHLMYHTKTKPFKCAICSASFTQKGNLNEHMITHFGNRIRPFRCDICKSGFTRKRYLNAHIMLHLRDLNK